MENSLAYTYLMISSCVSFISVTERGSVEIQKFESPSFDFLNRASFREQNPGYRPLETVPGQVFLQQSICTRLNLFYVDQNHLHLHLPHIQTFRADVYHR